MKKLEILLLFIVFNTISSIAQTVVWEMMPSDYSELTCINHRLFKVVKNGHVGLIKANGEIVAEANNDSISGYYEGKAVLVRTEGDKMVVSGCLTENGNYYPFANKYYKSKRQPGFPFYSENLMLVCNEQGLEGYIDEKGTPVLGFKREITHLQPFTEGYAVVKIKGRAALIDKNGTMVKMQLPTVGEVNIIFNPYKGVVYLTDDNGKFYTYDIRQKGVCTKAKSPGDKIRVDFLYRIRSLTKKGRLAEFKTISYKPQMGLPPIMDDSGLYGFETDENIVVPAQFTSATSFFDNISVVSLNNKKGVIRYIPNEKFVLTGPSSPFDFYKNDSVRCGFRVVVPETWEAKPISIVVKFPNGNEQEVKEVDGEYAFNIKPLDTSTLDFYVSISADGLLLHTGIVSAEFIKRERCLSCGKDKRNCEYHGLHPQEENDDDTNDESQNSDKKKERVSSKSDDFFKGGIVSRDRCETCGKDKRFCEYHGKHPNSRQRKK